MTHLLNVCSYNMRGFNSTKIPYVTDLLNRFSILFLIEHWLTNKQLSDLSANFPGYSISGVSDILDCNLLRGRPNGGVAVIYPDCYNKSVQFIDTDSRRLCAIGFQFNNIMIYFFCVYMPCDINDHDNLSEYDAILSEISALCIKNDVQNLCVLGDMNTDLSRSHSWHTQSLLRFIENEDLFITLNHSCADISYSYCNTYTNAFSIIDHIFVSQSLNGYICRNPNGP